ncbi:hypothetical protein, partial [Yersinia intermedia]|uniref:hypothetical protein n=1 Tax=Yersinia intermedia TaxID=631 RepID=UPI001CFD7B02
FFSHSHLVSVAHYISNKVSGMIRPLQVLPEGPGIIRFRLRVLGGELATPIEQEYAIETTGERLSLDFKCFRDYVTAEQAK